ncbi:MAG: 16S rRNA (guanine(527)-N(7))-methyltransferase RsmG, partial [Candidatus Binataceae bacterium]
MNPEVVGRETRSRVENHLGEIGFSPPAGVDFFTRIERFAAILAQWGSRTNLTAHPQDPSELAFHVIDSLAPLTVATQPDGAILEGCFAPDWRVLDLGSGAGFPGLILAAACDAPFTLAEGRHKRASFLRVAAAEMGLGNVAIQGLEENVSRETLAARSSTSCDSGAAPLPGDETNVSRETFVHRPERTPSAVGLSPDRSENVSRETVDLVLGRAFAKPEVFCRTAAARLRKGRRAILYARAEQPLPPVAVFPGPVEHLTISYQVPRG